MNAAEFKPNKSIRAIEALGSGVHQIAPRLYLRCIPRKAGLSRSVMLRWQEDGQPRNKSLGPWRSDLYGHFLAEAQRAGLAILEARDVAMAIDEGGAPGTYKASAEAYMAKNLSAFRSDKHRKRWRQLMERTYPVLGHLKIPQIEVAHVAKALEPDWLRTPVQVLRARGQIEQVLNFAIARGKLKCANAATLGLLKHLMPRQPKRAVRHMRAMSYSDVPALFKELEADGHVSAEALRFVLLTLCRSTEARVVTWPEVDAAKAVWTLPPGRVKMFKPHRVALSKQALAILDKVRVLRHRRGDYVFPGRGAGKPYSANMLRDTMKRVGFIDDGTPHGLRSTFKDWARETQHFNWEAVELCLAHEVGDDVERAYGRSDLLHLRVPIMAAWGAFVAGEPLEPRLSTEKSTSPEIAEIAFKRRAALRLVA
jgi:integrase